MYQQYCSTYLQLLTLQVGTAILPLLYGYALVQPFFALVLYILKSPKKIKTAKMKNDKSQFVEKTSITWKNPTYDRNHRSGKSFYEALNHFMSSLHAATSASFSALDSE